MRFRSSTLAQLLFTVWKIASIASFACFVESSVAQTTPNIVLINADDLGYGDLGCYGATKVRTPNIDRLSKEGRRFIDAHAASAVCSPSRYGLKCLLLHKRLRYGQRRNDSEKVPDGPWSPKKFVPATAADQREVFVALGIGNVELLQ